MPRQSLDGIRIHVILTKNHDRELRRLSKETGMTLADHIRRAIDHYLAEIAQKASAK
jgi:predicted DNA-binding protein